MEEVIVHGFMDYTVSLKEFYEMVGGARGGEMECMATFNGETHTIGEWNAKLP